jgi:transposase-like protein
MNEPLTLQEAIIYFSDPDRAFQFALNLRFPGGKVVCPRCASERHSFMKSRRIWECYGCKKQFSLKVGTIMEDSALGLDKWMMTAWMIAASKNGVSSYEISRSIGVTQKSAWFMLHRLREAMKNGSMTKLGGNNGPVEMDETFVGGKVKNMHKSRIKAKFHGKPTQGGYGKAVVMGMLERGGQVRAQVVEGRHKHHLAPVINANVEGGSHIITDEFTTYTKLGNDYYHEIINHVEGYVREHVHTNGIENFWALLKRGLNGTYVSVEPFHLDAYVTEQVFRYNNRATKDNPLNDADRFALLMSQVGGKRLTYSELTGKMGQPPQQA